MGYEVYVDNKIDQMDQLSHQKHTIRVLVVAHVGETVGHLVRGLTLADALAAHGAEVHVATSADGWGFLAPSPYQYHPLPWNWSHNRLQWPLHPSQLAAVEATNRTLLALLNYLRPDLIVSLPGVFTAQAARSRGIPHVSVAHGVYLSGLVNPCDYDAIGRSVIRGGESFFVRQGEVLFEHLSDRLGLPSLSYKAWLSEEQILVPDPFIPLLHQVNLWRVPALRSGYGLPPPLDIARLRETCLISFGSGNPCDIEPVLRAAVAHFPHVLSVTGRTRPRISHPRVTTVAAVNSLLVAPHIRAVISHGGLGTVGTFLGLPQLLVPTEIDQATTSLHVQRAGVANAVGLERWLKGPVLGRELTADAGELDTACVRLAQQDGHVDATGLDGASTAADLLLRFATKTDAVLTA
jgi:Glycosyltransferase Family 4